MTKISSIDDQFSVSPQFIKDDFECAAREGFKSIINLRPDGEAEGCLSDARASSMARQSDLAYVYFPIALGGLLPEQVAAFGNLLSSLPTPILAYCGSGRRAAILWALASASGAGVDYVLGCCGRGGHDLITLRPALEALVAEARARP